MKLLLAGIKIDKLGNEVFVQASLAVPETQFVVILTFRVQLVWQLSKSNRNQSGFPQVQRVFLLAKALTN